MAPTKVPRINWKIRSQVFEELFDLLTDWANDAVKENLELRQQNEALVQDATRHRLDAIGRERRP